MSNRKPMTIKGKEKLEKELQQLMNVERPKVIQAIEEAREHGDLSENADYDAAKERQAFIEARISEVSDQIANSEVIDVSKIKSDKITFGASVTLEDEAGKNFTYQIVGEEESDVSQQKISVNSPLARHLIGKIKGDSIEFQSPKGEQFYTIIDFFFK